MATESTTVAIGCQGGGSHTAFSAGALRTLLPNLPADHEIVAISGTSGGALCATTAWYGLVTAGPEAAADRLGSLWADLSADSPVQRTVNDALVWTERLNSLGFPVPSASPYDVPVSETAQRQLLGTVEQYVDFEAIPDLVDDETSRLLLSAVDVTAGSFEVFEAEQLAPECLLASTAVPTLFPAVEFDETGYWDGLFSQNPPIRNFLAGYPDVDRKPDEIWILQINPTDCEAIPRRSPAIVDRQRELAGNLSLNQEVAFVEQVNEWVDEGLLPGERYKHVDVERITLDRELSHATKLDRDPAFVEDLLETGAREAEAFLAGRGTDVRAVGREDPAPRP